jgi:hypothetical protein
LAPLLLVDLDCLGPSDQVHVGTRDAGFNEFAPTRVSLGRIVDDGDCVPRREEHATPMWRGIPEAMCVCLVLVHGASREWSGPTISFANALTSTNRLHMSVRLTRRPRPTPTWPTANIGL